MSTDVASLTWRRVTIRQTSPGSTQIIGETAGDPTRLFYLFGSLTAAGSIAIIDTEGMDIIPEFEVLADTVVVFGPFPNIEYAPKTADHRGLRIMTTGGSFRGYAVVAQGEIG